MATVASPLDRPIIESEEEKSLIKSEYISKIEDVFTHIKEGTHVLYDIDSTLIGFLKDTIPGTFPIRNVLNFINQNWRGSRQEFIQKRMNDVRTSSFEITKVNPYIISNRINSDKKGLNNRIWNTSFIAEMLSSAKFETKNMFFNSNRQSIVSKDNATLNAAANRIIENIDWSKDTVDIVLVVDNLIPFVVPRERIYLEQLVNLVSEKTGKTVTGKLLVVNKYKFITDPAKKMFGILSGTEQ